MQLTRKEDISVYLYIKDTVIGPRYSEITTGESLTLTSTVNTWDMGYDIGLGFNPFKRHVLIDPVKDIYKDYSGLGRGLLYFDYVGETCLFGVEQQDRIKVYFGSTDLTNYKVNYITGQITSSEDLTSYSIDYEWNYVAVIDSWPYEDVPALPIVCVDMQKAAKSPLQLGGGDIRGAYWNIQIFANNKGERDDLMDLIYDNLYLRRCPLYLLPAGLPLLNGLYNEMFDSSLHNVYTSIFFENVQKRLSGLPQWGFYEQERINRYRAEITFDTRTYKN
jgi:hypothetical protein